MNYGHVIIKSAFRNRRRTTLTVVSIAFSLFLLCTLQTILTELDRVSALDTTALRLVVRRATSLGDPLPESYRAKLERVPFVTEVTDLNWFGGVYIDERNFFPNFASDPNTFFKVFSELSTSPEVILKWQRSRQGAIVGRKLSDKYGWKIGDRVTLKSVIFLVDMEFIINGIYEGPDETWFVFRSDYFRDSLQYDYGNGTYWLRVSSPDKMPVVTQYVDNMFRNTPFETKTETEKQFNLEFINMLGNIRSLITSISIVVIFTILLVCSTTMAMSIREQIRDVAVFKTLGFSRYTLYGFLISEAVIITTLGGLVGCFGARILYQKIDMAALTMNFFPQFVVTPQTIMIGMAVSLLMGLFSAIIPAWNAIRMPVTEGLKHLG